MAENMAAAHQGYVQNTHPWQLGSGQICGLTDHQLGPWQGVLWRLSWTLLASTWQEGDGMRQFTSSRNHSMGVQPLVRDEGGQT